MAKHATRMHTWLGVPIVILTTIVGSTIFASLSETPEVGWRIAAGLLSLSAAVLAALQTFFKYSETSEKHRMTAAEYASLKRKFDAFQLRVAEFEGDRDEVLSALEDIVTDLDRLEKDSLDVPDSLYDRAVEEQRSDEEGV